MKRKIIGRPRSHSFDLEDDEVDAFLKNLKPKPKTLPAINEDEESDTEEAPKESTLKQVASSTGTDSTASMNSSSTTDMTPTTPPKNSNLWDGWDYESYS